MAAEARALPLGPRLALDLGDQQEEVKEEEEYQQKAPEVFPPPAGPCLGVACGVRDTGVLLGNSFQTFLIQRAAWFDSGCMRLLDVFYTFSS